MALSLDLMSGWEDRDITCQNKGSPIETSIITRHF